MKLEKLKELREKENLTQEYVANILGIDRTTYTSFEIGRDTISIERLNIFANYFDVSIDYLLGLTNIKKYKNSKKDIDIHIVATRLKETRKENKYTQEYVAKLLNTNHSVWCRYEQGKYLINTSFLYSYCIKTKLSSDFLLGKIDNPKYLK